MANEDIKEKLEKLGIDYPKSANRTQLEKLLVEAANPPECVRVNTSQTGARLSTARCSARSRTASCLPSPGMLRTAGNPCAGMARRGASWRGSPRQTGRT